MNNKTTLRYLSITVWCFSEEENMPCPRFKISALAPKIQNSTKYVNVIGTAIEQR